MRAVHTLQNHLEAFVADKGFTWPPKANIEPPRDAKFGDLATNLAMMLTKQAKTNPRALAEEIVAFLNTREDDIQSAEVAGPGFINVTFSPAFWQRTAPEVLEAGEAYGRVDVGQGARFQVEYVSANPTGPLHIGHGRGAAIGDSLARILDFAGYKVFTEYYVNDAGRQMRLLGTAVWVRLQQSQGRDVELPEECYKGDYIKDIAADVLAAHPGILDMDEDEAVSICREAAHTVILQGIKKDLADFGAKHEKWFSENKLVQSGAVEKRFEWLKEKGLAYEKDGALWMGTEAFGDDKDRVLRKSDGSLTYFASDIAYHADKYDRGFQYCVDVWGADHHGYIPRMRAAVEAMGQPREAFDVVLVQLVNLLRDGEQIAMSTRAGKFETLADVCAEVGADASRFIFLSRKSDSPLDFDLELVKRKSMDNPVYYVQYAHARIASVHKKAAEAGAKASAPTPVALALLDTAEDLQLMKLMERFPDTVATAARSLSPHHVSYYLMELAGALHRYYGAHHILVDDKALSGARLMLMSAVAAVIRNGLALLGVSAPESM